ncbi:MAG: helix-turn-helix domain-containing protein [Ruminococcus sp.]|jgi:looped-hinge helix DNA binding domain, AbrB family|nr:helix-turn-helix domain-containing protein [Ruminococcus sp.]MBQ1903996.1 helix-turn-helix domain-containing protein [Ruminococcus sp.]MBQ3935965.1 helix-turn-helix domain-containing protein [Ruminococcus sp.]MBQ9868852.1 helix-turn-helix domain-containing protein [Ruminococcus sp.]MCR5478825.1 helix-turn-helix domain-containing protein [Ruminococcus sp.]
MSSVDFSRLKRFRTQSGMTQEELAEKLGVSRQAVAKWERGESVPDIDCCMKLAEIYGVTVDILVRSFGKQEHTGDGKHIFGLSRVNSKGQVTLPASCRKVFDIKPGDTILVLGDENKGGIAMVKIGGFMDDLGKLIHKDKE